METEKVEYTPEEKEARALVAQSPEYQKIKAQNLAFMDPTRLQVMRQLAQTFVESGAMPKDDNAPKVIMKLQAGYERGMSPIESVNSFYFVNGKLSIYGEAAIKQVIKAGHKVKWGECNAETATVTIERGDNGETATQTFTMEEAQARGYVSKNAIYQKFPENMLRFRAFSMLAKFIVPDALSGVMIVEELQSAGHVIEGEIEKEETPEKPEKKSRKKKEATPIVHESLDEALKKPAEEPEEKADPKIDAEPVQRDANGKLV